MKYILVSILSFSILMGCSQDTSKSVEYREVPTPPVPSEETYLTIEKIGNGVVYIKDGDTVVKECTDSICKIPLTDKILTIQPQADYDSKIDPWTDKCQIFISDCYIFPNKTNQTVKVNFSERWNKTLGGSFNYNDIEFMEYISDEEVIVWSSSIFIDNKKKVSLGKDPSSKSNFIYFVNPKTNKIIKQKEILKDYEIVKIKKIVNKYYIVYHKSGYYGIDVTNDFFESFTKIGSFSSGGSYESPVQDIAIDENNLYLVTNEYLYIVNMNDSASRRWSLVSSSNLRIWVSNQHIYIYQDQNKLQIRDKTSLERMTILEEQFQSSDCSEKTLTYSNSNFLYLLCEDKLTKIFKDSTKSDIHLQNYNYTKKAKHGAQSMLFSNYIPNSRVMTVWEIGDNIYISKKSKSLVTGKETSILKFSAEGMLDENFPNINLYPSYPIDFFNFSDDGKITVLGSFKFINDMPTGILSQYDLTENKPIPSIRNKQKGIISNFNPKIEPVNIAKYKPFRSNTYMLVSGNFEYYDEQKVFGIFSMGYEGKINNSFSLSDLPGLGYDYYLDNYFEPIVTNSHIILRFVNMEYKHYRNLYYEWHNYYIYKAFTITGKEIPFPIGADLNVRNRVIRIQNNPGCYFIQKEPEYKYEYFCGLNKSSFNLNLSLSGIAEPYILEIIPSESGYFIILDYGGYYLTHIDFQGNEDYKPMISLPSFKFVTEKLIYSSVSLDNSKNPYQEKSIMLIGHFFQDPKMCSFLILKDIPDFSLEFPYHCTKDYKIHYPLFMFTSPLVHYSEWKRDVHSVLMNGNLYVTGLSFMLEGESRNYIKNILSFEPILGTLNSTFVHKFARNNLSDIDEQNYFSNMIEWNGYLYISGKFDHYGDTPISGLIRLNLDGTLAD